MSENSSPEFEYGTSPRLIAMGSQATSTDKDLKRRASLDYQKIPMTEGLKQDAIKMQGTSHAEII